MSGTPEDLERRAQYNRESRINRVKQLMVSAEKKRREIQDAKIVGLSYEDRLEEYIATAESVLENIKSVEDPMAILNDLISRGEGLGL